MERIVFPLTDSLHHQAVLAGGDLVTAKRIGDLRKGLPLGVGARRGDGGVHGGDFRARTAVCSGSPTVLAAGIS
jgi:hypothetical protein